MPVRLLVLLVLLLCGPEGSARAAPAAAFPILFDVGDVQLNATLKALVPRVLFDEVFECPHPCGLLPEYSPTKSPPVINGGIPQLANKTLHLATLKATFDRYVPLNESRLIDLDFESWNPVWERNEVGGYTYNASLALAKAQHPSWSPGQQLAAAKAAFEAAALDLLVSTITYARSIRSAIRIGMYGFPTRYYYHGYNSTSGDALRAQNDNLFAIWCRLDALFPSVYQFYNSCLHPTSKGPNQQYVASNIREAARLAAEVPARCGGRAAPPVLAYSWSKYHDGLSDVCKADLEMFWQQGYAAGADGLVLWGYRPTAPDQADFAAWYAHEFAPLVNAWHPPTA